MKNPMIKYLDKYGILVILGPITIPIIWIMKGWTLLFGKLLDMTKIFED